jgi:arylsulfatase A-like enzyme
MLRPARQFLQLSAPRHAVRLGLAVGLPMLSALMALKLLKLPTGHPSGLFAPDLFPAALELAADALHGSDLLIAIALFLGAHLLVRWTVPAAQRRRAHVVAAVFVVLLLSLGVADGFLLPPPTPSFLFNAWADARVVGALFWRDVVVALAAGVLVAWHAARSDVAPSRMRSAIVVAALVAITLLFSIDAAYFAASRAEITTDELVYVLASPRDALVAARDGLDRQTLQVLLIPWAGLALAAAAVAWTLRGGSRAEGARLVPAGVLLWPIVIVIAVTAHGPLGQRVERLSDNLLFRLVDDALHLRGLDLLERAAANEPVSARVPRVTPPAVQLAAAAGAPGRRHNVVLVLLESVRADATTLYVPALPTTPVLARLAADSLVVERMYANLPRTSAAWIATVAGRVPGTVSMQRSWLQRQPQPVEPASLARQLAGSGYATAFFVPTRLNFENDAELVHALGFEHVTSLESLGGRAPPHVNTFGVEDRALLPPLRAWLDRQVETGTPFFATIMTNVGHFPYRTPMDWPVRQFGGVPEARNDYYNAVAYADGFVGAVVDELTARGVLDDTLLIVLGDHGEAFNEHGLVWHTGVPYEEALRIPGLVRLPGPVRRAGRIEGLRQQIDVWPTVAAVLGLEVPLGSTPGRSMLDDADGHRALFFSTHFDSAALALLDGNMKYVYWFGRRPTEAYDLSADPGERVDIAARLPSADVAAAERDMRRWLHDVRRTYRDDTRG